MGLPSCIARLEIIFTDKHFTLIRDTVMTMLIIVIIYNSKKSSVLICKNLATLHVPSP